MLLRLQRASLLFLFSFSSSIPCIFRLIYKCYKLKPLELDQRKNLVLGLIQENLIENSVQDCLPYILIPNGPCKPFLAYPK